MAQKPTLMTTTLWDFPSQQYGDESQGDQEYKGATPAYLIWNLLQRYTKPKDLVVDPMAGSGTTLDVARELGCRALGYDLNVTRKDVFRADARRLHLLGSLHDHINQLFSGLFINVLVVRAAEQREFRKQAAG